MSDKPGTKPELDVMRMLADFRLPAMPDLEALAASQRKNIEALSNANRVALEGAQTIARRHMEIMQQAMTEMTSAVQQLASQEAPQARAAAR